MLRTEFGTKVTKVAVRTKFPVKQAKSGLSWGFLTKQPHLALRSEFWTKQGKPAVRLGFPSKLPNLALSWEEQPKRTLMQDVQNNTGQHTHVENNMAKIAATSGNMLR